MKLTTKDMFLENQIVKEHDDWMTRRVEYMYDYMDFDNQRKNVRERFLNEMHKKTTLKDIGEKLDEFTYSSKAAIMDNWDDKTHILEQPVQAQKDKSDKDFDWYSSIIASFDPRTPTWLDDPSQIDEEPTMERFAAKEIIAEVKFNDAMRDHSIGSLT